MRASQRRANRLARKRIRARRREYRRITAYAAHLGVELMPWQIEFLVTTLAGPDPRTERANQRRLFHPHARRSGKTITLAFYDELRKDTTA